MPDPALQRYLAEHYISGPKSDAILKRYGDDGQKKKKRKKREGADGGGLLIQDEATVWFGEEAPAEEDEEEGVAPDFSISDVSVPSTSSKPSGWKSVRAAGPDVAQAQETPAQAPVPIKAGLMSREAIKAQREAREAQHAHETQSAEAHAAAQEAETTVYRDAQGRRINVEDEETRIRAEQLEAERKDKERKVWGQGVVQRRAKHAQQAEQQAVQEEGVVRHADDARMNDILKEQIHPDDPAKHFLTRRAGRRAVRPTYEGPPPPPNRFGIKPGYRWDGVDRSNGFERKLFLKLNANERLRAEFQAWSAEAM
ncbi:Pre-mRNA-splicing factor cwc26 [Malassezia vespertilionis]|uniref:Cwc26p n=1 Tax=Malassezia vespertilionis TaxID=2020962 RepID=A0A2N1JAY4_9BASI|nr:Pre-mRNA-splicing factor cwc26 [Malassezia vespertilionis]PKI83711.1 Cwc26p [Malassezia vespertilionis]WFD07338.1 Pre-mRNA-splicing factor cwc26 [Malassezia vespertilionis]